MINKNRIVPITKTDLLTMYATVLSMFEMTATSTIKALDTEGNYHIAEGTRGFCDQPVKSIDLSAAATNNSSVFFVASMDFTGITADGEDIVLSNDSPIKTSEVIKDGATLYRLVTAAGENVIILLGPEVD